MLATQDSMAMPAHSSNPLRVTLILVVGAVLCATVPFFEHAGVYAMVAALAGCVIVPVWYDWSRQRLDVFEPIHVIGLVYFVFAGLGAIWTVQDPRNVAYDRYVVPYIPEALLYCLLGYLALLAGYYGPWRDRRTVCRQPEQARGTVLMIIPGILGLLGYFALGPTARSVQEGRAVPALLSTLAQFIPLFLFAWTFAWLTFFSRQSTRKQRLVLFCGLIPTMLIVTYLSVSDKSTFMSLVGLPVVAWWYCRRKLPWKLLLVMLLLLIFVVFPFYNTYRIVDEKKSTMKRLSMTYDVVQRWESGSYLKHSWVAFKGRAALINSPAVVVRDVGRWVPYAKGRTIFEPLLGLIPRVLWPGKPAFVLGWEFSRTFRVVHVLDKKTFMAATIPGELYWNFDLPGVLVGMALLGCAIRFVYRRYAEGAATCSVALAIYVVALVDLSLAMTGHIAQLYGLARTLLLFEIMRWLARYLNVIRPDPGRQALPESSPTTASVSS